MALAFWDILRCQRGQKCPEHPEKNRKLPFRVLSAPACNAWNLPHSLLDLKLDFLANAPKKIKKQQIQVEDFCLPQFVRQYKSTTRTTMRRGAASGICPSVAETHKYQWWMVKMVIAGWSVCRSFYIPGVVSFHSKQHGCRMC